MKPGIVRILIVDDHPLIRSGLAAELQKAPDMTIAGEASDADEAISRSRSLKPDLMLLDIALPGKSGLEVLKELQLELPDIKIIMLSGFPERQYAIRCLKDGASGYITKDTASTDLISAIRKVMNGEKFISASLADLLVAEIGPDVKRLPHEDLSDREFQILCLVGQGNTISEIAKILSLSISTINTYRARILTKLRLKTTAQLIRYVLDNNLTVIKK